MSSPLAVFVISSDVENGLHGRPVSSALPSTAAVEPITLIFAGLDGKIHGRDGKSSHTKRVMLNHIFLAAFTGKVRWEVDSGGAPLF